MQEGLLCPHSDPTIQMTSTGLWILSSELVIDLAQHYSQNFKHSTGSFETASLVGGVENKLRRQ